MYGAGRGIARNDVEASNWYRKAADHGDLAGAFNLGLMYANGQGMARNDAEAVKWFRKAGDQGFAVAQNNLGFMYIYGRGVPRDKVQAYKWLDLAATANSKFAQGRDSLARMMTPAQVAEAQKLAKEWRPVSSASNQ
jgi:TPR repeat protein